jgi:hypothetical protein
MVNPVYMTTASTVTPANASACDIVLVAAARVRNMALMQSTVTKVNKKKIKNWAGSLLKPPRK